MMDQLWLERVTKDQKDFIYEEHRSGDYIAYHCHKPGTSTYAFEIIIGKMGIYVGGDIGHLVYSVSRNIEFLAGNDIDYYQHSKLESTYYDKKELDKDRLKEYLSNLLWERLPSDEDEPTDQPDSLEKIVEYYKEHDLNKDEWECREKETKPHNHAWSLYEKLAGRDNLQEICQEIYDSRCYDGDMPDISKADESVMYCMYMVHYAAKKILEQKNQTPPTKE